MLDHVGLVDTAQRLRAAVDAVLTQDNIRTQDLGGTASTTEYSQALVARVQG